MLFPALYWPAIVFIVTNREPSDRAIAYLGVCCYEYVELRSFIYFHMIYHSLEVFCIKGIPHSLEITVFIVFISNSFKRKGCGELDRRGISINKRHRLKMILYQWAMNGPENFNGNWRTKSDINGFLVYSHFLPFAIM